MNKDIPISELPGASPSASVQLNRIGVATAADLLKADYEQVSVLLDSFQEADCLLDEARKLFPAEAAPTPKRTPRAPRGQRHPRPEAAPPPPAPPPVSSAPSTLIEQPAPGPAVPAQVPSSDLPQAGRAEDALAVAARGLNLAEAAGRAALARRLSAAAVMLAHASEEREVIAALLIECHEAGVISVEEASERFGARVASALDEAAYLRAVPMSPSGRTPKVYLDMAAKASAMARRSVAALQLAGLEADSTGSQTPTWYLSTLAEALGAAGDDPLVRRLAARIASRAAA